MYTIAELIANLQKLDQASLVLVGCLWTRQGIRDFIEDTFDESGDITDDMIDELMIEVDCIDNYDSETIISEIYGLCD